MLVGIRIFLFFVSIKGSILLVYKMLEICENFLEPNILVSDGIIFSNY